MGFRVPNGRRVIAVPPNGKGSDTEGTKTGPGIGLIGMKERIRLVSGSKRKGHFRGKRVFRQLDCFTNR